MQLLLLLKWEQFDIRAWKMGLMAYKHRKLLVHILGICSLFILTACTSSKTPFKFHSAIGICNADEELYEGETFPLDIETDEGNIRVDYVIWKQNSLYVQLLVEDKLDENRWDKIDQNIRVEDSENILPSLSNIYDYDEESHLIVEKEYRCNKPQDQYVMHLFNQEVKFSLSPIKIRDNLQEIGTPVTHNGRTLVFCGTWDNEQMLRLNAWSRSDDIWQIDRLDTFPESSKNNISDTPIIWKKSGLDGSKNFEASVAIQKEKGYDLNITDVTLMAEFKEDAPIINVPVPSEIGIEEVMLSFSIGKDTYDIKKVERRERKQQNKDETVIEIILYVEPQVLEKNTELLSINASWGIEAMSGTYSFNKSTFPPAMYLTGELANRQELTLVYTDDEPIPEIAAVRIDNIAKIWHQEYSCTIK